MLKTFLFIILVMLMKPVIAASLMSHEKFVLLDYSEQRKIVIATMELIVEMESKYQHEVKTSGFNPERFRRYTEFMKSVSNIFFPEAHAAPIRHRKNGQYLHDLTQILGKKDKCLYGGWISEMRGTKCTHPQNSRFANQYQRESYCSGGNNQITCNPAIFGFKDVTSHSLFCVDAGEGRADNSSFHCMQKALGIMADPVGRTSSTEDRIKDIVKGIQDNPNDSNRMYDFLLKACVCDASQTPEISAHYANYMRPHQTCYSILKMMTEVTSRPDCRTNGEPLMSETQLGFLRQIKEALTPAQMSQPDVAQIYKGLLDGFVTGTEARAICTPPSGNNNNSNGTTDGGTPTRETPGDGIQVNDPGQTPTVNEPGTPTGDPGTTNNPGTNGGPGTTNDSGTNGGPGTTNGPGNGPGTTGGTPTDPEDNSEDDSEEDTPQAPASTDVTITVTGKTKDATTVTVDVAINPADTDWSLYTLIWSSQGETRATDQNVSGTRTIVAATTDNIAGADAGTEPTVDNSRDAGDKETILNRDDARTLDVPRLANDYKMCARLIKKSDKSIEDTNKCATIPRRAVQAPRGNGNPFGPQQMMPTRGGPSDAVFRGVR